MATYELIESKDRRWLAALSNGATDVYALPAYAELSALMDGGKACAFLWQDQSCTILVPLVVRENEAGLCDVWSPYGYPGIVVPKDLIGDLSPRFFEDLVAALREVNAVTLFLRLHPLLNTTIVWPQDLGVTSCSATVYVPLKNLVVDNNQIPKCFCKSHRWGVRKLHSLGFVSEMDVLGDDVCLRSFVDLYHQTMRRVGATEAYFYDYDYFKLLRSCLSGSVSLAVVRAPNGSVASGGLIFQYEGKLQLHLAGADDRYSDIAPNKLLIADLCNYYASKNMNWLHLGGGVGGEHDSLFSYKKRFSTDLGYFKTIKYIINEDAYAQLSGKKIDDFTYNGFFPIYRSRTIRFFSDRSSDVAA